MKNVLFILLTICIVILVITFIKISIDDGISIILYGLVFAIILGYGIYSLLIKNIIVEKNYSLYIFNKFGYDDEVKDHFENLYKEKNKINVKFRICFNLFLSYCLTCILFYNLELSKFWFNRDITYYLIKIAIILGFYLIIYLCYKILNKYMGTNSKFSINQAYSKVIEEYLINPFYFNKAKELIEKAPLATFKIEYYYLEIIKYYAVKKKDIKRALSMVDNTNEKYFKVISLLYLAQLLIRRKEKAEAMKLLNTVINLVDNGYDLFKGDIYSDLTDLFIKLQEYKEAQIYLLKATKSIEDRGWLSTIAQASREEILKKNKIKLDRLSKTLIGSINEL